MTDISSNTAYDGARVQSLPTSISVFNKEKFYIERGGMYMREDGKWFHAMNTLRDSGYDGGTYFSDRRSAQRCLDRMRQKSGTIKVNINDTTLELERTSASASAPEPEPVNSDMLEALIWAEAAIKGLILAYGAKSSSMIEPSLESTVLKRVQDAITKAKDRK